MPFVRHGREIQSSSERPFRNIDAIVRERVIPSLEWENQYVRILPNGLLEPSDRGRMDTKDPKRYFALACLGAGLHLPEVGYWIDTVLMDPVESGLRAQEETLFRFDLRKPWYEFASVPRCYLFRGASTS